MFECHAWISNNFLEKAVSVLLEAYGVCVLYVWYACMQHDCIFCLNYFSSINLGKHCILLVVSTSPLIFLKIAMQCLTFVRWFQWFFKSNKSRWFGRHHVGVWVVPHTFLVSAWILLLYQAGILRMTLCTHYARVLPQTNRSGVAGQNSASGCFFNSPL